MSMEPGSHVDPNNVGWDGPESDVEIVFALPPGEEVPSIEKIVVWFAKIFNFLKIDTSKKFVTYPVRDGHLPWTFNGEGIFLKPGHKYWNLNMSWGRDPVQNMNDKELLETIWKTAEDNGLKPIFVVHGLELCYIMDEKALESGAYKKTVFTGNAYVWIDEGIFGHAECYRDWKPLTEEEMQWYSN